jgi:hypothetical protein
MMAQLYQNSMLQCTRAVVDGVAFVSCIRQNAQQDDQR